MKQKSLLIGLVFLAIALVMPAWAATDSVIVGKLAIVPGQDSVLKTGDKEYRLSSTDESLSATLRDRRLADRQVRLEGKPKGRDRFEVQRLYTVRGGKLYRVVYFCDVCNITAFKPGDCDCCQAPTELVEVPPDDPRVAVK